MTWGCACTGQCSMSQHAGPTVVGGIRMWTGMNLRVADVGALTRENRNAPVILSVTS